MPLYQPLMEFLHLTIFCAILIGPVQSTANVSADPLSISPSGYWDGNDGWWSTFFIEVGSPPQTLKVLPATSASAGDTTWVIIPQGCTVENPTLAGCGSLRGHIFYANESATWTLKRPDNSQPLANNGLFQLITVEENLLGLDGNNAYYGFDTIQLGLQGSGVPSIQGQLIAGIGTNDFWLGTLGLSPIPFNFTDYSHPIPSLLSTLRNDGHIPSISWGYTAGAYYLEPPVFGSLTLGGYDESQFNSATALRDVPFGADFSRDLLLSLKRIHFDGNGESDDLLTDSIYIFIDSMVSQMWLPQETCNQFEDAFHLDFNTTLQTYVVSEDTHRDLLDLNPTFTFTLGFKDNSVDITFPYAAFDLNFTEPISSDGLRYFPLKPATEETQYTLGRVFLQEAYVTVDYARHNFTVAQAKHPSTSVEQSLVAITPPGSATETKSKNGLGAGAIAGIVLGIVLFLVLGAGAWWCYRRRKNQRCKPAPQRPTGVAELEKRRAERSTADQELDGNERFEMDRNEHVSELQAGRHGHELDAGKFAHELDVNRNPQELEGTPVR